MKDPAGIITIPAGRMMLSVIGRLPVLLAGEEGLRLLGEVDERLTADVDEDGHDGAAGERPRRAAGVVVGHGRRAVEADVEPLSREGELPGLGADPALADLLVADVEG